MSANTVPVFLVDSVAVAVRVGFNDGSRTLLARGRTPGADGRI